MALSGGDGCNSASITVADLSRALRAGDDAESQAEIGRLLGVAEALIKRHLRGADCPVEIRGEAVIRVASYLFDQPTAGRTVSFANAMRNSGAAALIAPFRVHRAGSVEADG